MMVLGYAFVKFFLREIRHQFGENETSCVHPPSSGVTFGRKVGPICRATIQIVPSHNSCYRIEDKSLIDSRKVLYRTLVSADNPIRPGGGVAAYLYAGGATVLRNDEFRRPETVQSFDLHFDYRPNAPGSRPTPGYSLTGKPFLSVGFGGGIYQVNFMIPPIPDGVQLPRCDGAAIRSNLIITISGANSMDSASFCVEP